MPPESAIARRLAAIQRLTAEATREAERGPLVQRRFLSLRTASDRRDVGEDELVEALNVHNPRGDPTTLESRRGVVQHHFVDFLAAPLWVVGRAYVVGDVAFANGQTWRCNTGHTSTVFNTQIANWTVEPMSAIHIFGAPAPSENASAIVMVVNRQLHVAGLFNFQPRSLLAFPTRFEEAEPPIEEPPIEFQAAEWAYMQAFSTTNAVASRMLRVNINPFSDPAAADYPGKLDHIALTPAWATAVALQHNPWVIKGMDNRAYFLAWRSKSNQATTPTTELTHYGRWGPPGDDLLEGSWNPQLNGIQRNDFETDDVPRFLTLSSGMELILMGDNDGDADPRFEGRNDQPPGPTNASDIIWRLPTGGGIPPSLHAGATGGAVRARLRHGTPDGEREEARQGRWQDQRNSGYPQLHGLGDGTFLMATTYRAGGLAADGAELDDGTPITGDYLRLRRFEWKDELPRIMENSTIWLTTGNAPADGRNALAASQVTLASRTIAAVARGTDGLTLVPFQQGAQTVQRNQVPGGGVFPADADINMVVTAMKFGRVYAVDVGPTFARCHIYVFDTNLSHIVTHTETTYPNLAHEFRGLFLEVNERILWVVTYNSAGLNGKLLMTGIDLVHHNWAPTTGYSRGTVLVDPTTNRRILWVIGEAYVSSADLATDLAAGKIIVVKSTFGGNITGEAPSPTLDTSGMTDVEPHVVAFVDSAGAQMRRLMETSGGGPGEGAR